MIEKFQSPASWWQDHPSTSARLTRGALAPLAFAYGAMAGWRMRRPGTRVGVPVICVGNLTVGGAGKTPTALALAQHLIARGERVWFLSRGYRSAAEGGPPVRVAPGHGASDVGDEALLLARIAPTLVSADRVRAAQIAAEQGASVLILDDGLQNPALAKDLRLLVIDAGAGIGNGFTLPAGPMRAPLAAQFACTDVVVMIGEGAPGARLAKAATDRGKEVMQARLAFPAEAAAALAGRRVCAFAGIGRPEKFFAMLEAAGALVVEKTAFADHYAYRGAEIARLQRAAQAQDALLVTTEKDFVRLAAADVDPALPVPVAVPVTLDFADKDALGGLLSRAICRASGQAS